MNNTSGSRHVHVSRHRAAHRKKTAPTPEKAAATPTGRLFTFTLDADTARIVKFALLDPSGTQRELSTDEKAELLRAGRDGTFEEVIARAFEAGIQCVLEDAGATHEEIYESQESDESEAAQEDVLLRRLLLERLIERSAARNLLGREALARALLETLIHYSIDEPPATTGPGNGVTAGRTAHARTNPH